MAHARELAVVRVRFSPSPTGHWHIGGMRTALFNWLFARRHKGVFIVRIEDTDAERSRPEYETEVLEALQWLGLDWDEGPVVATDNWQLATGKLKINDSKLEANSQLLKVKGQFGPYRQSERKHIYKKYLEKLLDEGRAYYCYCTKEELEAERNSFTAQGLPPKYIGHCRNLASPPAGRTPELIRFRTPEAKVEFKDMIRGTVSFDAALFGDIVIARNLNSVLYNFAVVVDDHEMQISHVIRGEEHLSNTPKQILLQKAIGAEEPLYAHLPLILAPNREKLSKRFTEASILSYREAGYMPEAIINFLALLGWHPKDNQELFSRDELIQTFDIRRVQKAGAVFNEEKLNWLNAQYIRKLDVDEIILRLTPILHANNINTSKEFLRKIVPVIAERAATLQDFLHFGGFFFALPDYTPELLIWKESTPAKTADILEKISEQFQTLEPTDFHRERLVFALAELIDEEGKGSVLWPLRVAVSGKAASPDPIEIVEILGRDECLIRLKKAIAGLRNHTATL